MNPLESGLRTALTFDDILLVPRHSTVLPAQVDVTTAADGGTVLVVTDDGSGPGGGAPGLGSAIIAQATRGRWTLVAGDEGGAVVRAEVRPSPERG